MVTGNRILHTYVCGSLYGIELLGDVLLVIIGVWRFIQYNFEWKVVVLSRPEVMLKKNCCRYKHFAMNGLLKFDEWLDSGDARLFSHIMLL